MPEVISLRFKFTEEEYMAAVRLYLKRSLRRTMLFFISSMLICGSLFLLMQMHLDPTVAFVFIFAGVTCLMLWLIACFVTPRQRFRRDPRFKDEYMFQFSNEGIHLKTPHVDSLIQWSIYTKVIENERFYLLAQGQSVMTVLPKRAFASASDQSAFDAMLRRNLPGCFGPQRLKTVAAAQAEKQYLPPAEPPDWR